MQAMVLAMAGSMSPNLLYAQTLAADPKRSRWCHNVGPSGVRSIVRKQLKDRQVVVVDTLRHGHVPKLKEVHLIVVECIVLAMCSDQVYGGRVDLSCGMLGCGASSIFASSNLLFSI